MAGIPVGTTPKTNYAYFKQRWWESAPEKRRRWKIFLVVSAALWLAGAISAFLTVAGIVRLGSGARLLAAAVMGPMGLPWGLLKLMGVIVETTDEPNLLWLALAALSAGSLWLAGQALAAEPNAEVQQQRRHEQQWQAQGRLPDEEVAEKLAVETGVPLAEVTVAKKQTVTVGIDYETGEGHALVTGPTRSGKGLHLTATLLQWPGAAIVVDPKGEQYRRTAGYREKHFGPVYRLPGHQVHLAYYYDYLLDRDSLLELHGHLLRPGQSRERIFADKSRSLFSAVAHFARVRRLNPLRVLLDMAESDPVVAMRGLETVAAAKQYVRLFTDGLPPEKYQENRFATSAFGTLTTRLAGYQKHVDAIAPAQNSETVIPRDWAAQRATLYIIYPLADLEGAGGVVSAIMAGLMRYQLRSNLRDRMLVAIDELPSVGLYNVADYLSTVGGYGITLLLYVQAISQLAGVYGRDGAQSILANTAHQLWYAPADMATAKALSELYGTTYRPDIVTGTTRRDYHGQQGDRRYNVDRRQQQGWRLEPVLEPSAVMSLPREKVIVLTQHERQYRFLANRLNPIPLFERLPAPPRLPRVRPGRRTYTDWSNRPSPEDTEQPGPDGDGDDAAAEGGDGDVTPDVL
ncbi:MAG: type IV secretory system conjugative DNA transfer family protein [Chloroflexi bacterium]|nr:type IV secretory system conjugative DNA transfer family protein [Chloroflexota bacterium]